MTSCATPAPLAAVCCTPSGFEPASAGVPARSSMLEWIVIVLIVIEIVIGMVEIAGLVGWFGHER
jgi:hypothetical protein